MVILNTPLALTREQRLVKIERLAYWLSYDSASDMIYEYCQINQRYRQEEPTWPGICTNAGCEEVEEIPTRLACRVCPECKTATMRDVFDILGLYTDNVGD